MISAGKLSPKNARIPEVLQLMFCPSKGYAECGTHLKETLVELTDGMKPAEVDRFVQNVFPAAAFEINQYCGDEFKPNTQPTKKCFHKSIKEGYVKDTKDQQGIFKGGTKFISWIDHLVKAAKDRGAPCAGFGDLKDPITPLPADLIAYKAELRKAGLISLELIAYNLFREAQDDAAYKPEHDAAIVKSIKDAFKPYVDKIKGEKNAAKKAALIKEAEDALGRFFVLKIKDDGAVKFSPLPDAIWKADKSLGAKSILRKYFKAALKIYKTKPKAMDLLNGANRDKAIDTLGAKVIEAVKAAAGKPKKVTDVTVDGDGYATKVVMGDSKTPVMDATPAKIAEGIPIDLIRDLNIEDNAHALMAIKRIWLEVVAKNPKIIKPGAIQNKAIKTIIAQLKGKSPWKIAQAKVDKVAPDGAVTLKDIPSDGWADKFEALLNRLIPEVAYGVWRRINKLHQDAMTSKDRDATKSTEDVIGKALSKLIEETIYSKGDDGMEKFFDLRFKSFDSKTGAPIYEAKKGAGDGMPDWLRYKLEMKGYTNFGDFSGVLTGEVGGVHKVAPNVGVTWAIGAKSGREMDKFGVARQDSIDDEDLLLQKAPGNKEWAVLPKAMVGLTSLAKPKKGETLFNWGVDAGITFDPYYLEANFLGAWGKGTLLLSDVASVWAKIGGGGLLTLDVNGDPKVDTEFTAGFIDFKVGGSTKLWKGAKLDAWLWYMHAFKETVPDVFAFDTTIAQELPKGFGLAAELFYGMNVGDKAPDFSALYFNPSASWRSPNIVDDFAFVLSFSYDLLKLTGSSPRHGVGPGVSFAKKDGSVSFDLGYRYYMQGAADAKGFDQGSGFSTGDTRIVSDPGATGHYATFGITVKTP